MRIIAKSGVLAILAILTPLWPSRAAGLADPANRIFHEDFSHGLDQAPDGSRLWMTAFPFGNRQVRTLTGGHELECYTDPSTGADPFAVAPLPGGAGEAALTITAAPSAANPCHLPYASGLITTFGSFRMLYGYVEARMALPLGPAVWPGFWLLPADNQGRSELDILEGFGFDPAAYYATGIAQFAGINDQTRVPLDRPAQFHRYGVDWEADRIVWYLDGRPVKTMATPPQMHTPMYVLLNLALYGPGSWQARREAALNMKPMGGKAQMVVADIAAYRTPGTLSVEHGPGLAHVPPQ